jgi:hypothetical protein
MSKWIEDAVAVKTLRILGAQNFYSEREQLVFCTPKALKGVCSIANPNLKLSPQNGGRLKTC